MDIATIIGMIGAFAAFGYLIDGTGQVRMFMEIEPFVFVVAGTMLGVMIRFSLGHFIKSLQLWRRPLLVVMTTLSR